MAIENPLYLNNGKELEKAKKALVVAKQLNKPVIFLKQGVHGGSLVLEKPKYTSTDIALYALEHGSVKAGAKFKMTSQSVSYHLKKHRDASSRV